MRSEVLVELDSVADDPMFNVNLVEVTLQPSLPVNGRFLGSFLSTCPGDTESEMDDRDRFHCC